MPRPTLFDHPKFVRLVYILRMPEPHVLGHLEYLWRVGYASGDPRVGDSIDVELAAKWVGDPGILTSALLEVGFLDDMDGTLSIHNLHKNAPKYVADRDRRESERAIPKTCESCGATYHSTDARSRSCGDTCRQRLSRLSRQSVSQSVTVGSVTVTDLSRMSRDMSHLSRTCHTTPTPTPTSIDSESGDGRSADLPPCRPVPKRPARPSVSIDDLEAIRSAWNDSEPVRSRRVSESAPVSAWKGAKLHVTAAIVAHGLDWAVAYVRAAMAVPRWVGEGSAHPSSQSGVVWTVTLPWLFKPAHVSKALEGGWSGLDIESARARASANGNGTGIANHPNLRAAELIDQFPAATDDERAEYRTRAIAQGNFLGDWFNDFHQRHTRSWR